ncbi:transglycosylase SLT domain-containing protein [Rhodobacteraceae bacterium D3-12]|nr:transglycosylase SLT domain-containing protein [Rhodobacteraceae bacterium D3-12]
MSRPLRALILLMLLASCGGGRDYQAPREFDNACSILKSRPHYVRAFRATERKWNVPVHVQMATIYQESKFKADARTPFRWAIGVIPMGRQSSAYGYSQALDATWKEYKQATGNSRAKRNNIRDASDFMGWYMNITKERNGIALSDARNQYLAYHEGHTGYRRGTYRAKAWLMRVSGEVGARSKTYEAQLKRCGRLR